MSEPGFLHEADQPTRGTLRVSETFTSRQGEGKLTGTESFFIRTSGCNLRCWFCDTPYASWHPEGRHQSIESITQNALQSGCRHVVLTGGEPMLPKESVGLCQQLRDAGLHITIETSGTVDRTLPCDLLSLSPKLRSSTPNASEHPRWSRLHSERRLPLTTMRALIDRAADFQLKFVVDGEADFAEIDELVEQLAVAAEQVWIMPQGVTVAAIDAAAAWLRPMTRSRGFHYCDRMQIRWYGNRRGT